MHQRRIHSHYSCENNPEVCTSPPNPNLRRASTTIINDRIIVLTAATRLGTPVEIDDDLTLDDITLKAPSLSWFNTYLSYTLSTSALRQHIISGTALAVSDGSYYPNEEVGACAWTISTPYGQERIQGGGGLFQDQKRTRTAIGLNLVDS